MPEFHHIAECVFSEEEIEAVVDEIKILPLLIKNDLVDKPTPSQYLAYRILSKHGIKFEN
jgi:hypothetical protein